MGCNESVPAVDASSRRSSVTTDRARELRALANPLTVDIDVPLNQFDSSSEGSFSARGEPHDDDLEDTDEEEYESPEEQYCFDGATHQLRGDSCTPEFTAPHSPTDTNLFSLYSAESVGEEVPAVRDLRGIMKKRRRSAHSPNSSCNSSRTASPCKNGVLDHNAGSPGSSLGGPPPPSCRRRTLRGPLMDEDATPPQESPTTLPQPSDHQQNDDSLTFMGASNYTVGTSCEQAVPPRLRVGDNSCSASQADSDLENEEELLPLVLRGVDSTSTISCPSANSRTDGVANANAERPAATVLSRVLRAPTHERPPSNMLCPIGGTPESAYFGSEQHEIFEDLEENFRRESSAFLATEPPTGDQYLAWECAAAKRKMEMREKLEEIRQVKMQEDREKIIDSLQSSPTMLERHDSRRTMPAENPHISSETQALLSSAHSSPQTGMIPMLATPVRSPDEPTTTLTSVQEPGSPSCSPKLVRKVSSWIESTAPSLPPSQAPPCEAD